MISPLVTISPGFDLNEALGCFRLDPKCKCHIDQQMSLAVMGFANHIQRSDLLIHVRRDPTWHGQQIVPDGG